MNFTRRQVVEQLEDLRITKGGIQFALASLQGLWQRRRAAVDRLEVSTLHRPMKEDVKLPMAGLQDR